MKNRVLIVEDHRTTADILTKIAQKLGFEVDVMHSMADLTAALVEFKDYFCACVDFHLPDAHDGEAIDQTVAAKIPTFVLTGKLDEQVRQKVMAKAVVDFILKETVHSFDYVGKLLTRLKRNMQVSILVVDDSLSVRKYLRTLLERQNFTVIEAVDGEDALERLKAHPQIKVVITDYEMPKMSGVELTSKIRRKNPHEKIAILAISSSNNAMLTARFLKNGANDALNKPFDAEEFYTRIFRNLEYIEQVEEIEFAANHDFLTKIKNRRCFFELSNQALKTASKPSALALLDLDHFKAINDTYGHEAGDIVLVQAAQRMMAHFKDGIVARLGGEEFCVLLPETSIDEALGRLEFLCHHFESFEFKVLQKVLSVTTSIGLVEVSAQDISTALKQADEALYAAKGNGRNQVVQYQNSNTLVS
ncbi:response regulator [Catenovulum agarivorans]|uniref:GGDEF domain-containing response regulator n=1 Tax=Catenovulum agarivorans TaxID=1172192 RepID=UPI0002FEC0F3|nr:response regulator [Catenovulum agarivorans]